MENKYPKIKIGKVQKVFNDYAIIQTKELEKFVIFKNEITDFNRNINNILRQNDLINFVVLSFNSEKNEGKGSFKRNHTNELNNRIIYKLKETPGGFKNLLSFTLANISKKTTGKHTKNGIENVKN
ncbi:RNA-binding protein [Mycoplasma sp. CSL10166]|uniref:RNA-binding protein n=1 Tax=Mycoplasma sp. CSL10166 TaxID=2813825 RepID=UPI00197C6B05|nr:RNA-binding protein [Mycoplasma sp. CSL10166]MBN4084333.1 RNA-binding protein [Mycoplasma sp. CSL10166]